MKLDLVSTADGAVCVVGSGKSYRVTNAREAARFLADDVDVLIVARGDVFEVIAVREPTKGEEIDLLWSMVRPLAASLGGDGVRSARVVFDALPLDRHAALMWDVLHALANACGVSMGWTFPSIVRRALDRLPPAERLLYAADLEAVERFTSDPAIDTSFGGIGG